jgi:hypothetical protein
MLSTLLLLLALGSLRALAQGPAVPPQMAFQGRLTHPDGTPLPDGPYAVRFSLWTQATGGTQKWNQTQNVTLRNGTFAVLLNTSTGAADTFQGSLFLEIKLGSDPPLTPRQPLSSVAYAFKADGVKEGAISTSSLATNAVTSGKIADGTITSADIANGTITAADLAANALNNLAWLLDGNSGDLTGKFLGSTGNFPLELRTNNRRAMRYQYAERTNIPIEYRSINVLGGADINEIGDGIVGGTISGGGADNFTQGDEPNRVMADYGAIGGGYRNNVTNSASVVSGGHDNNADGAYSNIGGGETNTTGGQYAAVGGGYGNRALGLAATIPGGFRNAATGRTSFAAGNRAYANHNGAFVWGDSTESDLFSTGTDQFIIRANGGVGINKNNPVPGTLDVAGSVLIRDWMGIGTDAPWGALHIKGFQGALNLEGTSDHVYMQFFPRGVAQGRKAYIGFPFAGSHDLNIANEDGGAVRVIGTFVNNSDARYKTNLTALPHALEAVLKLRGVAYDWRTDLPGQHFTAQRQIGFIAQEVEQVLPELVYTDTEGYKSVAYVNVVPVLVEAIKQQHKQMTLLKTQNEQKENELSELKKQVEMLTQAVQQLQEASSRR